MVSYLLKHFNSSYIPYKNTYKFFKSYRKKHKHHRTFKKNPATDSTEVQPSKNRCSICMIVVIEQSMTKSDQQDGMPMTQEGRGSKSGGLVWVTTSATRSGRLSSPTLRIYVLERVWRNCTSEPELGQGTKDRERFILLSFSPSDDDGLCQVFNVDKACPARKVWITF